MYCFSLQCGQDLTVLILHSNKLMTSVESMEIIEPHC